MCTGIKHCHDCEGRASDNDVVLYTAGISHVKPKITDGALALATDLRRKQLVQRLMIARDPAVVDFPEFKGFWCERQYRDSTITSMRPNFDRLIALLPAFRAHTEANGFRSSGQTRKARRKAKMLWKRKTIVSFVRCHPDGLEQMIEAVGWSKPWWMQKVDYVESAIAA